MDSAFDRFNISHKDFMKRSNEAFTLYFSYARQVQFVMFVLLGGVINHFASKRFGYPYTVGCFLLGMLVGILDLNSSFVRNFTDLAKMNPSDLMLIFLPVLIFESSFGMDPHMFSRAMAQCLTLALPGLVICTILTAVFAQFALVSYQFSWITAFLFGSIVSATDPVAVVALLKEMRMPHTFTILIEGESLLNDGVAIVMYETLSHFLYTHWTFSFSSIVMDLLKTCFGAPLFGVFTAIIAEWILNAIYISPVSEMCITLVIAYVTYFSAEHFLGVSAVLAVVLYGVTLNSNKMCISPESESLVQTDWRLLCTYANTLIFTMVGVLISLHLKAYIDIKDIALIICTYIALTVIRGFMVLVCYPILKSTGYGLTWKEAVILVWGGLRGAVGLALALMFMSNRNLRPDVKTHKVLVQTSGIIILTIIVNATTIKHIMKLIKFREITLVHRLSMGNAIACVNEMRQKSVRVCKNDWKYKNTDWDWLLKQTQLHDPYQGGLYGNDPNMHSLFMPYGTCDECLASILPYIPSDNETSELTEATRKKVLRAIKGNFWKQFREGLIERRALKYLNSAIDKAFDTPNEYLLADDVSTKLMSVNAISHYVEAEMAALFTSYFHGSLDEKERQYLIIEHTKGFRKLCSNIYLSLWFEPLMMVVVILIVLKASLFIDYTINSTMTREMGNVFRILNLVSSIVLILDLTVQIVSLKWSYYRKRWANIFYFTVTCIVIVDGISEYIVMTSHESLHSLVFSYIRLIIVFQLARAMRIFKLLLYNISTVLRQMASDSLYNVYDIGRGFLFANEEVLKKMDVIVDFDPCGDRPVAVCKENVVKMLKILSEFEKLYPEVTYALKSNRAARRILNRAMPVLERFKEKSIVLRDDMKELRSLLFTMKKEVVYAPKLRCIIGDVNTLLNNAFWVRHSKLADILKDNHETEHHNPGHVLQAAGDVHEYVYIIASGIVKVTGRKYDPKESSHELYNRLPNTDTFFIFERGEGEVVEHLMKSQSIGILGFLVGTPSETTAVCERDCQFIKVHHTFLNKVQIRNAVSYAMWRYVAIKVGAAILRQQHQYFGFPDEDIYARLENGILPELKSVTAFEVPPIVEDIVIIQGKAKDSETHASFYGPAYVPHGFKTLVFYEDVRKRPPTIVILMISSSVQQNISRKTWVQLTDI